MRVQVQVTMHRVLPCATCSPLRKMQNYCDFEGIFVHPHGRKTSVWEKITIVSRAGP